MPSPKGRPVLSKNNNLFKQITDKNNMYDAYKKSRKGNGKYKVQAMKFAANETYNLNKLRNSLIDGSYRFSGYIRFKVYEPKERVIHAPTYKDKIVQLSINNILKQIYNPCFIYDSYACIDDKGTHECVDRISHFMRKAKWEYGDNAYIIKMDIKKFFYSINRDILKKLYRKKIKCKRTLELIYKIIDSADSISELGLPLGNTLSQISANLYMNVIDQYAKRTLSLKYYVRYADDIVIIVKDKQKAQETLDNLKNAINSKLELQLNKRKTKIFPIDQGVNAIGYKIHCTHRLLRNCSKKKIKRKCRKFKGLYNKGLITREKIEEIINSWYGHASHGSSFNFILSLIERNNYIYIERDSLKVDVSILEKG